MPLFLLLSAIHPRVVPRRVAVFALFASEHETLLLWWDTFLVLNFGLDIFNPVKFSWLDIVRDMIIRL